MAVRPDTKGFGPETEKSVTSSVTGIAKKAAAIIGGAFVVSKGFQFLSSSVDAARESNKVAAQTEAAIKSTGMAAHVTAGQVGDLATAISNKTGVDDEAIQTAANLLLTFTDVRNEVGKGNDIFNQATKIATDMGAALGTDASGSAIQLGKALNDPIAGISALTRVGVTFTDQQKDQIKTLTESGDKVGAQKIILAELSKEFGGSAAAQATAADRLKVTMGNLQEKIGNALIPVLDKVSTFLADHLPEALAATGRAFVTAQRIVEAITPTVLAVVDAVRKFVVFVQTDVVPVVERIVKVITEKFGELVAAVSERWAAISEAIGHVLKAVGILVAVALAPIILAWKLFHDQIIAVVKIVWDQVKAYVEFAIRLVRDVIDLVLALINGDWGKAWDALKDIVGAVLGLIVTTVKNALAILWQVVQAGLAAIGALWSFVWDGLKGMVSGAIDGVVGFFRDLPKRILEFEFAIASAAVRIGKAVIGGILGALGDAVGFAADIAKAIGGAVTGFINNHLIEPINSGIRALASALADVNIPGIGRAFDAASDLIKKVQLPHLAAGGIVKANPGVGLLARIGEGTRDEAVLPLPPGLLEGLQAIANGDRGRGRPGRDAPLIGQVQLIDPEPQRRLRELVLAMTEAQYLETVG